MQEEYLLCMQEVGGPRERGSPGLQSQFLNYGRSVSYHDSKALCLLYMPGCCLGVCSEGLETVLLTILFEGFFFFSLWLSQGWAIKDQLVG